MACPRCKRPERVTAYANYVAYADVCTCDPTATAQHVTGHAYPPLAYAKVAPSLADQAAVRAGAMDFQELATPTPTANGSASYAGSAYTPLEADQPVYVLPPPALGNVPRARINFDNICEDTIHNRNDLIGVHLRWSRALPAHTEPNMLGTVRYIFHPDERRSLEVTISGSQLTWRGRPMDTTGARKVIRQTRASGAGPMGEITNRFIYVMSLDGEIYAADASGEYKAGGVFDMSEFKVGINNTWEKAQAFGGSVRAERKELKAFHHSSFLGGYDVACAGEIEVVNGTLLSVNNNSGHYTPPPVCLVALVDRLRKGGVDVEALRIGINVSRGNVHGGMHYFKGMTLFKSWLERPTPLA